ncbi:hypothetical protein [Pseudomonas cichorii]|uniref:hypothetical protein n=1 Tax=Pseudomonas cichorii TaxID=36746 RepID=UPI001C8AD1EA|nr:hypothetical protein [Pseudomonas cichorii]MBX8483452.1 hypothetical protein [Pseudomonas cichorii]MBX8493409.1 hypothetical protein [Pseudomonas cichorii]MBX8513686.1 hypothetical protein [Pseudomonas cichorii]MBX8573911.1 hypothetical protein [Pseudomonas cichorii]
MDTSNSRSTGSLDPSFGNSGIFTFANDVYGTFSIGGPALGPDGGIIVAGRAHTAPEGDSYAIARLTEDGQPVPQFGQNGMVTGQFKPQKTSSAGVTAYTPDGKILISGYYREAPFSEAKPSLARHLVSGEIDTGFGEDGVVFFDFPPPKVPEPDNAQPSGGPPDTLHEYFSFRVTPLPDGKIVFSGVIEPVRDNFTTSFSVLGRLNADGSLDKTFANQGYLYPKPPRNIVDRHQVQQDGSILLAGQMENVQGHRGYVARYLPDGELDRTFGSAGYLLIEGLEGGHITAIATHGNNGLVVGANKPPSDNPKTWLGVLMGLTTDGAWDPAFNDGNPLEVKLGTSGHKLVLKDLVIDGDGIVLFGNMGNIALARYFLDGTADVSYGNSGWWEYSGNESYSLIRQTDGKIVATAMSITGEKIVARYMGN